MQGLAGRITVIDVVNAIGLLADLRDWTGLRNCFADELLVDYTSRDGGKPLKMAANELVADWRERLGGFSATQHLIANHLVALNGSRALCRSTFRSQHRLGSEQWDLDGRYRHDLILLDRTWRVNAMQMIGDFERGDRALVDRAANTLDKRG